MTVRDGYQTLEVRVESIEGDRALVIDSFGRQKTLRADVRRGNGPAPRVGEIWLIDRSLGNWTFAASLIASPPVVTGDARGVGAMENLLSILAANGLIKDETTSTPPSPSETGLPDGAVDGEFLKFVSTAPQWVPAEPHQVFVDDPTAPEYRLVVAPSTTGPHSVPTGAYFPFVGTTAPDGYLLCQGQAVSRTTYAALFAVMGIAHGAGDGSTTFNLPNLQGRFVVGMSAGDADISTVGRTGGEKAHTLTSTEMPSHTHGQNPHTHVQDAHGHAVVSVGTLAGPGGQMWADYSPGGGTTVYTAMGNAGIAMWANPYHAQAVVASNQYTTATNQNTGGGGAHNNMPPYVSANYIVKV